MSAIQKELAQATDVEPSKRKNETIESPDYMKRLAAAVADMPEKDWDKLSSEAKDWYNSVADALEAKKDIPAFPDLPKAEASTRRRSGSGETAEAKPYKAKKGDVVDVVTKRGRDYTGKIVELDDDGMVLDVDGKDVELDHDKIEKISLADAAVREAAGDPGDDGPAEPEVGDTVEVVTKRDKVVVGNITEMTDTDMVVKDSTGEIHEFDKDRLKSVKVKVKNAGKGEAKSTSREKADDKGDKGDEKKKITKAANGGVSATQRMRELICADLDAKKDAIAAALKKENLEFKQATLDLIYADSHKLIGILRENKRLK